MNNNLTKELIRLAIPLIFSNLAYTFLGAIDTLFLGRVSTISLGAVGLAHMMFLTISLLLRGTISGTTVFVSRMYGAGDRPGAGRYLQYFLSLSLLLSPLVLALPWIFRLYLGLLAPAEAIAREASIYTSIRLLELPFSMMNTAIIGFMVGTGNSRAPMLLAWSAVLVNVLANYVLIFGHLGFPPLGIAGAAWGTVLAVLVQLFIATLVLSRYYAGEYLLRRWQFPSWKSLGEMIKIGFPIGITDGVELAAFSTFFGLIARLGTVELAASQVANQIGSIAFMPGFALGSATGALVGQYMGSRRLVLAKSVGYRGTLLGAVTMGGVGFFFWLFAEHLGRLFTDDPAVLALTAVLLRIMAIYQLFDGVNIVARGALNGAGDTRFTMVVTVVSSWLIFIPSVYLLTFTLDKGLVGAWIGSIIYLLAMAGLFFWRFHSGRWQRISLRNGVG
ncbi:MAG: MATE family efflux transporter [Limnochordia bacterium]|jgi:MATE family multidrug resistance protein